MSNKCVVSFASHGRENYCKFLLGLIRSCNAADWRRNGGDYCIRTLDGYVDEYLGVPIINGSFPVTRRYGQCYNQAEAPYQFKVYAILEAMERGFDVVVWCDSSIRMVKDIQPLLDIAKERGVCAFDNLGHPLINWISDIALQQLGIMEWQLRDEQIKQIMACCIIFDFSNPIGVKVFEEWLAASRDGVSFQNGYGSTRPEFKGTRHDQACLSGILWKNKVELMSYGKLVYQPHNESKEFGDDFYFVNGATA